MKRAIQQKKGMIYKIFKKDAQILSPTNIPRVISIVDTRNITFSCL